MPWRAKKAEDLLLGGEWSDRLVGDAAEAALEGAEPLAHNGYKIRLLKTLVRRALAAVAG
jgi:xanthine dehydrogenase YagS FAD-binding subunit